MALAVIVLSLADHGSQDTLTAHKIPNGVCLGYREASHHGLTGKREHHTCDGSWTVEQHRQTR